MRKKQTQKTDSTVKTDGLRIAADRELQRGIAVDKYSRPIQPPKIANGVIPDRDRESVMALDAQSYAVADGMIGGGFPGFSYLANLSTRAEYRAAASAVSVELTRKWIEFVSTTGDESGAEKIKAIEAEFKRLDIRTAVQRAAAQECFFGRAQLYVEIEGDDKELPLILSPNTVRKNSLKRVTPVEAAWTTPATYNSLDPSAKDFYRPTAWFMMGVRVHASRLMTVITREMPDMLKPAYSFSGMSLSQMMEPYVDNWLRTRQSVADLINNFSITALKTSMEQVLQGADDGTNLLARAQLFTATRSNRGLMLLDSEREDLVQQNVPLGGLHELQAQSQEHMCSITRIPAVILTGISPSGLNASSEGEIRVFYDWISAQQESFWRYPLEVILKLVQLSLFGEIDEDVQLKFVPMMQMTDAEIAEIRLKNAQTAIAYIDSGVLDPSEERERLAADVDSGYQGLDVNTAPMGPDLLDEEFLKSDEKA